MNFKMLKATFISLALFVSGFANATLIDHKIDITYDGITSNYLYTGDGNLEQGGTFQLSIEADAFDYWNNMTSNFWAGILVTDGATRNGVYSWEYSLDGSSLSIGSVLNSNSSTVHIINYVDFYAGMFDKLVINYTLNTSTSSDINIISGYPYSFWAADQPFSANYIQGEAPQDVPEPSTLAIFALGLIGLGARRFKKQ